ncbi:MAG: M48 family metalloprotease [Gammaproteobacteria bacterium]
MKNHNAIRFSTVCALLLAATLWLPTDASALKLGDLLDKKALDQIAREKLGVQTDTSNPNDVSIPLVGNPSDADEERLGREIAGRLLGAAPLVDDDAVQRYVNRVGRYVAARSSRPDLNWTFGVIESPTVNAFAAPGGYVFVTRGLYAMLQSEAELAGVLGHEIAHVTERHHVKLLQKQRAIAAGQDVLASKAGSDSVKALVGNGAEIFARSLDKASEYDADRIGVQYSARGGYDVFALPAVLDRMGADSSADKFTLLYKTHPLPAERLNALDTAIGNRLDKLAPGATLEQRLVRLK